jgi:hypothetical protein
MIREPRPRTSSGNLVSRNHNNELPRLAPTDPRGEAYLDDGAAAEWGSETRGEEAGAWWDELVNFDLHTPERLNCGAVLGGISMGRRGRGWRRRRGREELGRDSGAHEEQNTRTELTAWATASAISSSKMPGQDRLHRTLPAARISSDGMH